MKLFIYLFLILFLISTASGQSSNNTKDTIPDTEAGLLEALTQYPNISFNSPKEQEELLLRIKSKSQKIGYSKGVLQSGDFLMGYYSSQGLNKKVIEMGNELKKIPKNDENIGVFASIYQRSALALGYMGLHEASLKDFKTALSYSKKIKDKDISLYFTSLCYENMTGYFHNKVYTNPEADHKENYDSIEYYLNKSLEAIKKIKDDKGGKISNNLKYDHIAFIDIRLGIFYLEQSELEKAEKHLLEAYRIHQNEAYNITGDDKAMLLNQLSWLYMEKKDYPKSIECANAALQLEKQFINPRNRVESFEFLASSYAQTGEKEKAAFYLREFTTLKDSIQFAERETADVTMNTIVKEIDEGYEKNLQQISVYSIIIIVVLAMAFYLFWRRRIKILHKKYEAIISKIKSEAEAEAEAETQVYDEEKGDDSQLIAAVGITDETIKILLRRLEKFEQSKFFLKKDMSSPSLANYLQTNTKYLTEIIKLRSNTTYTSYINGLRIGYVTRKLVEEPLYREYKIEYLAEECGYASRQVFIAAFKRETGFTPSYFIENLKSDASLKDLAES